MSRQNILKILFLSFILSSCGLIEKWKTPEQPTDSKAAATDTATTTAPKNDAGADDLFSKTLNETKEETALNAGTDAPSNVNTNPAKTDATKDDLKSLENEFSQNTTATTVKEVPAAPATQEVAAAPPAPESQPVKVEEAIPEIKAEVDPALAENANPNAGKVMSYKVQKGETLMQIAFKIYGDISKWKELKELNGTKLSKNSALRKNMEIKYKAPEKEFVWNPEGTPYLIKNGETLGTISNSVYQTPKKWKKIWENNKPLIKNPNVIYAGFTLYYKGEGMANYVQPKAVQKKVAAKKTTLKEEDAIEEVKVEQAISKLDKKEAGEIDLTEDVQSAPMRETAQE